MRVAFLLAAVTLLLSQSDAQELLGNTDLSAPLHASLGWAKYFKEPGWFGYSGEQGASWEILHEIKTKEAFIRNVRGVEPRSLLQVIAKPRGNKTYRFSFMSRYDGVAPRPVGKEATLEVRGYSESELGILSLELDPGEQGGRLLLSNGVYRMPISTNWTSGSIGFVASSNAQYIAVYFRGWAVIQADGKKNCFDLKQVSLMEEKPEGQAKGAER